ncbi:MAG TPA: EAL domain-containing protein [Candidatus Sulfotelmatobacter sp.]|jgi:diguanylate cyclase (GGDEF)-like protein/PAS domain S-box-containing protein|nr:EAL domain-containing protein [Candidatus Sulfotelmatobacter sp.]
MSSVLRLFRGDLLLGMTFGVVLLVTMLILLLLLAGVGGDGDSIPIQSFRDVQVGTVVSLGLLVAIFMLLVRQRELHLAVSKDSELLKYAMEAASDGFWDWGAGRASVFSARWLALHNLENGGAAPACVQDWLALVLPADRDHAQAEWESFLASGQELYRCDYRVSMGEGSVRWLRDEGAVVSRDAAGRPIRILGTTKDITEHHAAEAQKLLATSVFQNTAEAIVVTDPDAVVISVNPAFSAITGYAPEEAVGKTPRILKSDHNSPEFYTALWQTLLTSGQWQGELWNRRKDGEAFLAWQTISAVRDPAGTLVRFVSVFNDITELHHKDQHIRHQAFHDALTGLPNRLLLQDRLEHAIDIAYRESRPLAVMFIDLDRFKVINDSLGHDVGDSLLVEVTGRLKSCMRRSDTIARLGGDEFVVILTDFAGSSEVADVAEKIVASVLEPLDLKGHEIHVGASIGIAMYPQDGADVTTLMKGADTAMYRAKDAGRNTFRFFDAKLDGETVERLKLEAALRHALDKGEFQLYYQPKIDLATNAVSGAEALIRWNSPERGLVMPDRFIPLAEETGLILPIGDWVLGEACRQIAEWRDRGLPLIRVAVNVSARQFTNELLCERVGKLLEQYRLSAEMLEIELTESTVMADPERAVGQLQKLRDIGVAVSVDDFGTGYSSLSYLKKLPLSTIKIDRTFVRHLDQENENAAIVRAILGLGEALGMTAIAEGVETEGEARHLQEAGCHVAQGFKYSRPVPADDFQNWLTEWKDDSL